MTGEKATILTPFAPDYAGPTSYGYRPLDPTAIARQVIEQPEDFSFLQDDDPLFLESAPEYWYLISEDVATSPEALAQQSQEITGDNIADSSIAERQALSSIGDEAWRTSCSIGFIPILAKGEPEGVQWFRTTAVGEQPKPNELTDEQFADFSREAREAMGDRQGYMATAVGMIIHDIAKSKRFTEMAAAHGISIEAKDHDAIMREVMQNQPVRDALLPTLKRLGDVSPQAYQMVIDMLSVDANYGQLLQGEAPAKVIEQLTGLDERTRRLFFLHAKLDIAGVMGNRRHAGSTIIDKEVYQDTKDLEWALTAEGFDNANERYNAYLSRRALRLGLDIAALPAAEHPAAYAQVRLATMQRMHDPELFTRLRADFQAQPRVVQAIITDQLNRTGMTDGAILHGYGPAALQALARHPELSKNYMTIYAVLLQEAAILDANRPQQKAHVTMADLYSFVKDVNQDSVQAGASFRFRVETSPTGDTMLVPYVDNRDSLENIDDLELFDGEQLRGKRVLLVGMGGGKDALHADAVGKVLERKYGIIPVGIAGVHKKERPVRNPAQEMGWATFEINESTSARGPWLFPERLLTQKESSGSEKTRVFVMNSFNLEALHDDLREVVAATGAEVVIGVDPMSDSLASEAQYDQLPRHLATRQDHAVVKTLGRLGLPAHTVKIGISPYVSDAKARLTAMSAQRIDMQPEDVQLMLDTYDSHGMTNGDADEYSTTALLFKEAHDGHLGLRGIDLPVFEATSEENPWRVFHFVTKATGQLAISDATMHRSAIERK